MVWLLRSGFQEAQYQAPVNMPFKYTSVTCLVLLCKTLSLFLQAKFRWAFIKVQQKMRQVMYQESQA